MAALTVAGKLLIDTDPGIDDTMAIFYALASAELEVLALTTVFGNAATPTCTHNALGLLSIAERSDIPVAEGADRPLVEPWRGPADYVHGGDGQGNAGVPVSSAAALDVDAARLIVDTVRGAPGEVTLVALGPLTNVALALRTDPGLAADLKEIVLMGGNAFTAGNATPAAEANIVNDPEAADVVFAADCPIVMVGLDVTRQVVMTTADLAAYSRMDNPMARQIAAIVPFYAEFHRQRLGLEGINVHDSTCISYLLAPELFGWVDHPVCVDIGQSVCRGKTLAALRVGDQDVAWQDRRAVRILTSVDARAVVELEHGRLADAR